MTASMTTIDLEQDVLESVTTLFKLAAPSFSSCALSILFQSVLPLLLVSSLSVADINNAPYTIGQMTRSLDVCLPALDT